MRYFFECGNFPNISFTELCRVFEAYGYSKDGIRKVNDRIYLIEDRNITPDILHSLFYRLAGWVRYGEIIEDLDIFLEPFLKGKKIVYGISVFGESDIDIKDIQRLANEIKRGFKDNSISTRFVLPKKNELNAAQVINNHIIENGFELCIFEGSKGKIYGKTLGIQDIYSYVKRDIDKPSADYDMGVLPQKLAHIMCNLTGLREGNIWDPFCGSGTVLMEAAVLGFNILGSDIDINALDNANRNIQWLSKEKIIKDTKYNIFHLDIQNVQRKVIKELKATGIDAVVCEPYMGKPQRRILSEKSAEELINSVKLLYISLFTILNQISHTGFKVVLIVPAYKSKKGWLTLNISGLVGKKWSILNRKYTTQDLKWERINSIIARNIFILEKR